MTLSKTGIERQKNMGEWIWPIVEDAPSAKETARYAAAWAAILCGLSTLASVLVGLNPIGLVICLLYGFAAWRIWKESQAWAILAFSLCILQTILVVVRLPLMWAIAMPFAFLALMNGVRATSALRNFADQRAVADSMKARQQP
jgi:hypothetical protein